MPIEIPPNIPNTGFIDNELISNPLLIPTTVPIHNFIASAFLVSFKYSSSLNPQPKVV